VVVGWLVGVVVGVGELLGVGDGLEVGLLDGAAEGWLGVAGGAAGAEAAGVAEGTGAVGVAVGWLFAGPTTATGVADEAPAASRIPATMATTPPMAPIVTSRRVQEEAGFVPGTGPLPVNGVPLRGLDFSGLDWHGRHPARRPVLATAALGRITGVPPASPTKARTRACAGSRGTLFWALVRYRLVCARRLGVRPAHHSRSAAAAAGLTGRALASGSVNS
jgi:hypothetical protein